jgi:uncharacterized phage protein (TIGR01671 family)
MREIKFRSWDKEYNIMIEPNDIRPSNYELITGNGQVMEFEERHSYLGTDITFDDISDKRILMQYTGLKDKNGKEIYEGDIIQFSKNSNSIWKVYFNTELGFWGVENVGKDYGVILSELYQWGHWEIIGNIHENTDLLEK